MDSLTNRLLVTLGISTLFFGLSLYVIRVPIRTIIIFFALGKPVVLPMNLRRRKI